MNFLYFIIIILGLALIFYSPIFTIWALNTLFNLVIPVNLYTYLSTLWLTIIIAKPSNMVNWLKKE